MVRPSEVNCTSSRVDAPAMMLREPPPDAWIICRPVRPAILHGEEQPRGIGRPGDASHPAVQVLGQVRGPAGGAIEHHQTPAVAFISGARLRAEGEELSVRRIQGRIVGARAGGDFLDVAAGDRHHVDIGVGAGGRIRIDVHGERDFLRIGRNRVVVLAAERKRRNVVGSGRQILDFGAIRIHHHQMLAARASAIRSSGGRAAKCRCEP